MSEIEYETVDTRAIDPDYQNEQEYDRTGRKRKKLRKYSSIWTKFTIINSRDDIATCNTCGCNLSFKTTISNLKKHLLRKHHYDLNKQCVTPVIKRINKIIAPTRRPNLTELGGLDGLILNVVGEDGDDPNKVTDSEVLEEPEVYAEEVHDYCVISNGQDEEEGPSEMAGARASQDNVYESRKSTQQSGNVPKSQPNAKFQGRMEKNKRSRIMDLQLECLEIKKYTMQMEALMLEHQLNLPRSIYTETLRGADTNTRSTQTEVGGNNTKVFYVSDNLGSHERGHLFTFRARADD